MRRRSRSRASAGQRRLSVASTSSSVRRKSSSSRRSRAMRSLLAGDVDDRHVALQRFVGGAIALFQLAAVLVRRGRIGIEQRVAHVDRSHQDLSAHRRQQILRSRVARVDVRRALFQLGHSAGEVVARGQPDPANQSEADEDRRPDRRQHASILSRVQARRARPAQFPCSRAAKYSLQGIGQRRRRTLSSDRRMSKAPVPAIVFADIDSAPPVRLFDRGDRLAARARDARRPAHHARPLLAPDARRSRKHPPGSRHLSSVRVRRTARPRSCRSAISDRISKTPARSAATRRSSSDRPTSRSSTRCAASPIA